MGRDKNKKNDVANRMLQMQVMGSWNDYAGLLKSADEEVMSQFQKATRNIQSMVWVNVVMGIVVFIAAIGAMIFGVNEALQYDFEYIGIGISIVGLIVLLIILFRNPRNVSMV